MSNQIQQMRVQWKGNNLEIQIIKTNLFPNVLCSMGRCGCRLTTHPPSATVVLLIQHNKYFKHSPLHFKLQLIFKCLAPAILLGITEAAH